LQEGMYGVSI